MTDQKAIEVPAEVLLDALAEIVLPSVGLSRDMPFFTKILGFRLDKIFPADDPSVAILSGHGVRIRLDSTIDAGPPPPDLRLLVADPDKIADGRRELTAPNGMRVLFEDRDPPLVTPATRHSYIVRRLADQAPWVIGRAGMHYRDLIPDRLGGSPGREAPRQAGHPRGGRGRALLRRGQGGPPVRG